MSGRNVRKKTSIVLPSSAQRKIIGQGIKKIKGAKTKPKETIPAQSRSATFESLKRIQQKVTGRMLDSYGIKDKAVRKKINEAFQRAQYENLIRKDENKTMFYLSIVKTEVEKATGKNGLEFIRRSNHAFKRNQIQIFDNMDALLKEMDL